MIIFINILSVSFCFNVACQSNPQFGKIVNDKDVKYIIYCLGCYT